MTFTEYKEARAIMQELLAETYGEISKYDMKDFIEFLKTEKDLIVVGWKVGEVLPFDIKELVEIYIEQDPAYDLH